MKLLSLGAGVQSTTLALMVADGSLDHIDGAIFADTGWEPKRVYDHLGRLVTVLAAAAVPLYKVGVGNLRSDALDPAHRYASIPYFVQSEPGPCKRCGVTGAVADPETGDQVRCPRCRGTKWDDGKGQGRRQCTSEYKLGPIRRKARELLGAAAPDFKRVPRGRVAEQWIGFSTDEVHRVDDKRDVRYLTKRYPLLELGMSRDDCERWLRSRGWTSVTKSACIGCPFHGNRQWRQLRDACDCGHHRDSHYLGTGPCQISDCGELAVKLRNGYCACDGFGASEWQDALAFDAAIRKGGARGLPLNGEAFLHSSRVPLALAPIDRVTSREWHDRQTDIFGQLADLAEEGDPDGCSPFGCRSGAAS